MDTPTTVSFTYLIRSFEEDNVNWRLYLPFHLKPHLALLLAIYGEKPIFITASLDVYELYIS
jgi:hypothetical protein